MTGSEIWVYLERYGNGFEEVSLEILGRARQLADRFGHTVTAVILGRELPGEAGNAAGYGADRTLFIRNRKLEEYGTELYTSALAEVCANMKPDSLIVGATRNGRDLAARLAARMRTGLAANVVTLDINGDGTLHSGVPGYGSRVIADILCIKNRPQMSTVRQGAYHMAEFAPGRKAGTEVVDVDLGGLSNAVSVVSRVKQDSIDITGSRIVVVAGNGAAGDLDLVKKFAERIGADIGATRPLVDRGLFPREVQVGSTGVSLKADCAIVLGSSGSEHFVTGLANCGTVISVDINSESAIFDYSDVCVVGDVSSVLPELIKKLEVAQA